MFKIQTLGLLKYFLLSPLAGFMMFISIFQFLINFSPALADNIKSMTKIRKIKCWLYLSIFAGSLALLINSFSAV